MAIASYIAKTRHSNNDEAVVELKEKTEQLTANLQQAVDSFVTLTQEVNNLKEASVADSELDALRAELNGFKLEAVQLSAKSIKF